MATTAFLFPANSDLFLRDVAGRKGGKKRAQNLTPEERRESARKAAQARWAKDKKS
jgi:hypothetical protein